MERTLRATPEAAVLVGLVTPKQHRSTVEDHLRELTLLAQTAGAAVVKVIIQHRTHPDPATFIGKGKVEELRSWLQQHQVHLVIFDDDLSPSQTRNLETLLEAKVIDRTQLILQIFAQHARTREARTQVELAQLEYLLPRLTRMWTHLSKQYGGIGTKGPGEKQIEMDRRMFRSRIAVLKRKLAQISQQRTQQRKERHKFLRFSLVGYTNAGKSTLANALANAGVYAEDQLFATLDTVTRKILLPNGTPALLSDTVGFIRKLPPTLIASFHSTLAEITESDILLHVVDISHPNYEEQIAVVLETLKQLNAHRKPILTIFNKLDRLSDRQILPYALQHYAPAVAISATRGINISGLLQKMEELATQHHVTLTLQVPYSDAQILGKLYATAAVLQRSENEEGIHLVVQLPATQAARFQSYQAPQIAE